MNKNILTIGIIFLFVASALTPIVLGYNLTISKEIEPESTSSDGPMDSAWSMFQHDAKHTGRSPYGKEGNWRSLKWRLKTDGSVFSSPVIDENGTIYTGGWFDFYAINPDGSLKWQYGKLDGWVESAAAIDENGNIYFGTSYGNDGSFYALHPNGTKKWKYHLDNDVTSSPAIGNDGVIYFGDHNKKIYAFYPNGTLKWEYKTGGNVHTSPAIGDDGIIYCGSSDNYMYAFYPNGTIKWKYNAGCVIASDPTIADDGTIYFGGVESGALYALYPNGTYKWHLNLGSNVVSSPARAEDGTIYAVAYKGSSGAYIYSINPDSTINWQYEVGDSAVSASPAIDKFGTVYVGGWSGNLYAFNPDGTFKWLFHTDDSIHGSAAIDENGIIYVGSWDDYLYAIEPFDDNFPETPDIDGPLNGKPFSIYTYTATSSDLDGDDISYYFDWGDDTNTGWSEYVSSGTPISRSHSWLLHGTYAVRVGVKDIYDATTWETLYVTIPRNKALTNTLFMRFLQYFPLFKEVLLRHL